MRLYFAAPLFNTAERDFNKMVATHLREMGHEVFLPQETEQRDTTSREIFLGDVRGVDWADVVVANMDGADPDSGTCWECGYAYNKKPVILYRTDIREEREPFGPYNLMMHQAATRVLRCTAGTGALFDCETVALAINEAIKDVFGSSGPLPAANMHPDERLRWANDMRDGM